MRGKFYRVDHALALAIFVAICLRQLTLITIYDSFYAQIGREILQNPKMCQTYDVLLLSFRGDSERCLRHRQAPQPHHQDQTASIIS